NGARDDWFLKTRDEACVFLLPDKRCGIHAHFGAAAKPRVCRLFPVHPVLTIEGLKLGDGGECTTYAVSARAGELFSEDLPRIMELVPENLMLVHPIVQIGASTPV